MSVGRNEPCPCGSGKKHKHCCAGKAKRTPQSMWTGALVALVLLGALLFAGVSFMQNDDGGERSGATENRVWSEEHGHWHDAP
jgi:hypothetical protein